MSDSDNESYVSDHYENVENIEETIACLTKRQQKILKLLKTMSEKYRTVAISQDEIAKKLKISREEVLKKFNKMRKIWLKIALNLHGN